MSLLSRLLRRGPSEKLEEAREAHRDILSRSEEVTEVTTSLRESVRQPNHLAPLIENILRSAR
jgi:hypothetical protein